MDTTVENFSFLVSVLSAIASILVTWQIFIIFDLKRVQKEISSLRDKTVDDINDQLLILTRSQSLMFVTLASEKKSEGAFDNYLMYSLYSIYYAYKCGDIPSCNSTAEGLLSVISKKNDLSSDTANQAIDFLLQIEGRSEISAYHDLLRFLYSKT